MKSIKILLILCIFNHLVNAQTPYTTIYTPTNVAIEAIDYPELSPGQLAMIEAEAGDWLDDEGSNAVRVAPASATYNCHGFAWHHSDGGSADWVVQLTQSSQPNISKYWSGSAPTYQSTTAQKANKIFYPNGDHSAIAISSTLYESKWGAWPRYRHAPTDCPYNASGLQYYHIPVSGDGLICSSEGYSTLSISGATYDWDWNTISVSGSGSSVTASTSQDYTTGWIEAEISSPYSGTTVETERKTMYLGKQMPGSIGIQMDVPPNRLTASISEVPTASSYNWYKDGVMESGHIHVEIINRNSPYCGNTYLIQVEAVNACGTSNKKSKMPSEPSCFSIETFPNPTSDYVEVRLLDQAVIEGYGSPASIGIDQAGGSNFKSLLTDFSGRVVYSGEHSSPVFTLPLTDVRDGTYILSVTALDGTVTNERIIVNH